MYVAYVVINVVRVALNLNFKNILIKIKFLNRILDNSFRGVNGNLLENLRTKYFVIQIFTVCPFVGDQ